MKVTSKSFKAKVYSYVFSIVIYGLLLLSIFSFHYVFFTNHRVELLWVILIVIAFIILGTTSWICYIRSNTKNVISIADGKVIRELSVRMKYAVEEIEVEEIERIVVIKGFVANRIAERDRKSTLSYSFSAMYLSDIGYLKLYDGRTIVVVSGAPYRVNRIMQKFKQNLNDLK